MKENRQWLIRGIGIIAALVVIWVAAALFLNSAYASGLPFSMDVRSKLSADYSPDEAKGILGIFNLSIIGEVLTDLGIAPQLAGEREKVIEESLKDPVPTATALNFSGEDTWGTPTPEMTRVVQIAPGPMPTLTASAPARIKSSTAWPVAMLPAIARE